MKLVIYSHFFAPSVGGVETIVLALAGGLASRKTRDGKIQFETTVVTQTPAGETDDTSFPFAVVRRPSFWELWRQIRACDALHLAGPALLPLFLAWLSRKPSVVEHHGYQAICLNGLLVHHPDETICPGYFQARQYLTCLRCQERETPGLRSVAALLLAFPRNWLAKKAAANIGVTRHVSQRIQLPRSLVIYHGVKDPFGNQKCAPIATAKNEPLRFAFVGRFVSEKGIPILLEAAHRLSLEGKRFEVWLIGDGPERPKLERTIAENASENYVRMTGYLTGEALAEALQDISVIVMPSVWEETAGLAAIDQMMLGRLVIASDVGGLSEVVSDTGLVFPHSDAKALADCMRRVLEEPDLIQVKGLQARARATELFPLRGMIDAHANLYVTVLGESAD